MKHYYKKSKQKGDSGKAAIKKTFDGVLKPSSRGTDFINVFTGARIKLKTDSYISDNLFFERVHNDQTKEPGAPFTAKQNGCTVYAYYFEKTGQLYYIDLDRLIEYVEAGSAKGQFGSLVTVENEGYNAFGYRVPLKYLLKDVPNLTVDVNNSIDVLFFVRDVKQPLPEPKKPAKAETTPAVEQPSLLVLVENE